jgi:hypothetical protein
MKISTNITAALLAVGLVSLAKAADPVVYLTGSSAFRSTIETCLADNSGDSNAVFDAGSVTYETWGSSSAGSAGYMLFHGTIGGPANGVYVNCAWSGSEAGIASACNTTLGNSDRNGGSLALSGSPETWVDATNAGINLTTGGTINSGNPTGLMESSSHGADLAQADTSQAISWTPYVAGTQTALKDYGSEGVVTFTLTRNLQPAPSSAWLDCSNITLPQINVLLSVGAVPAGFISGNPADNDYEVYCVGRNRGSGTRMNMLACSTYGAHNTVHQYSIGYGCGDPGDPAQNINTLWLTNELNNGYESGGGVAKALNDTGGSTTSGSCQQADPFNGGTGWFAIGYLSPSDALSTGNAGVAGANTVPNWVTVDGVLSSNGAIENGSWWYWGHEHLYGKYQINGIQDTVGNALFKAASDYTQATYGSDPNGHDAGIPYSLMNVVKGVGNTSDTAFPSF